ncbi:hypothetical protein K2M58_05940 [Hydrogenibacillus sp. N12]|nr:hypothetical protein K2M58_05940 [Hydrogenibacillus sp. N12]
MTKGIFKGYFQMTVEKFTLDGEKRFTLVLRKPELILRREEHRERVLLVQETMRAEVEERRRLARELHDEIGQRTYSFFCAPVDRAGGRGRSDPGASGTALPGGRGGAPAGSPARPVEAVDAEIAEGGFVRDPHHFRPVAKAPPQTRTAGR